jgi:hypothetical protein
MARITELVHHGIIPLRARMAADLVTWEYAEIARALAARTGLGD